MASFELAIPITLAFEGGYVNDENDPGGETNFGISKRSYPTVDIANLTRDAASAIYERDFWKYTGITDQLCANKLFDTSVNLGPVHAVKYAQGVVGVPEDGRYGSLTEQGINGSDPQTFLTAYRQKLVDHYNNLAAQKPELAKFLKGWLRRANS